MDHNSPMYYNKYIKYKKKYLKIKEMEKSINGGSFFSKLKKGAQSITGTTPQNKFNSKVIKVMDKQLDEVNEKINKLLSGLESSQQKEIKKEFTKEFSNSKIYGTGPVAKAIKKLEGIIDTNGKELKDTTPEDEFETIMNELHDKDNVKAVSDNMISEGIKKVYDKVLKEAVESTSIKAKSLLVEGDDESTVKAIILMNEQTAIDILCKKVGLTSGIDTCSQDKIDVLKYALLEIEAAQKVSDKHMKGLDKSEDARKKAQDSIDVIGKDNGIDSLATYENTKKAIEKTLTDIKMKVISDIGIVIEGEVNKESLIKAISDAETVKVPNSKDSVPTTPITPTPETVNASV